MKKNVFFVMIFVVMMAYPVAASDDYLTIAVAESIKDIHILQKQQEMLNGNMATVKAKNIEQDNNISSLRDLVQGLQNKNKETDNELRRLRQENAKLNQMVSRLFAMLTRKQDAAVHTESDKGRKMEKKQ